MDDLGLVMHSHREDEMRVFAGAVADVMVILVFITLGANLPFDTMADEAVPALITLAALIFVARPLTVLASLLPDRRGRWSREEIVFLSWTRETGVVPAALVGILIADGVAQESELTTVVALAIVVTLLLQSTTKAWLARRLGLDESLAPGIRRARDRVEVARRETLEAERVEQTRVVAEQDLRHLTADSDHLVAVVRVEDCVRVGAHVVEDGESCRR